MNRVCVTVSCDALQARVDAATAQLQIDTATVSSLLDQLQSLVTAAGGMAPELAGLASQVSDALTELSAMYQDGSGDASAYAASVQDWAQGSGTRR